MVLVNASEKALMSENSKVDSAPQAHPARTEQSILHWVCYCVGVCLELLGMAFMGAVVVVFFGQVDARILLSLTAVGMLLFYGGWFCVRQGSRRSPTVEIQVMKEGEDDARRA
jgi:L-asparagine transporter-like permease